MMQYRQKQVVNMACCNTYAVMVSLYVHATTDNDMHVTEELLLQLVVS